MITEHALLPVISGLEEDFEEAFDQARLIIASMPGFISLSLSRSIETPSTYLLLVKWDSLEDRFQGIRPVSAVARAVAPLLRAVSQRRTLRTGELCFALDD